VVTWKALFAQPGVTAIGGTGELLDAVVLLAS
jgi:hypothetical protein